jgi:CRISPR-associated endonuclease/helicase Cas3
MVGAHHGQFRSRNGIRKTARQLESFEPAEWAELREQAARIAEEHLLPPALHALPELTDVSTATMALTGFTILCDWLGSDERLFVPTPDLDLDSYLPQSRLRARHAVEAAGFCRSTRSSAPVQFAGLFLDRSPPRPLQAAVDEIPESLLAGPCLAIIEAPTGEGKTEAALALAHRLAQASGTDEMYYALPTTATSNQMYGRLEEHLRDRLALHASVELIHGQAFLAKDDLQIQPLDNAEPADQRAAIEWFTSKKRALLAPFGVGTIDQAELAALNVKHSALRLAGLAGKVLILDEVHAYDTYMTTIVETLCRWLSALGTSVVLLSATLPRAQRTALAHAYGVRSDIDERDAYPCLWVLRPGQPAYTAHPPAWKPDRKLGIRDLHLADDASEAKAEWLLDAMADGGCACWITNTVDRAQKLYEALDDSSLSDDVDLMLLHARFPLEDRGRIEQALIKRFGPGHRETPRKAGIVVGTQVLEQSLDLDFDVMVSDLAPVDLLLQRAGRLQRHDRARPAQHADGPVLWINFEQDESGGPLLGVDRHIYDEFLLRQTWQVLRGRDELCLPADYRVLVEAVYGVRTVDGDDPLAKAWDALLKKRSDAIKKAKQRLLPDPDPEWSFCSDAARLVFEEDETGASWVVAQTRLGRPSLNVIPLERIGERARLYPGNESVSIDRPAEAEMQLRLLRRQLRVSNYYIVEALGQSSLPALFTKSSRLKGCVPLWLTEGRAEFPLKKGKVVVRLDDALGLVIRHEKGEQV